MEQRKLNDTDTVYMRQTKALVQIQGFSFGRTCFQYCKSERPCCLAKIIFAAACHLCRWLIGLQDQGGVILRTLYTSARQVALGCIQVKPDLNCC